MLSITATSSFATSSKMITFEGISPDAEVEIVEECDVKEKKCITDLIEKYAKEFNYSKKMAKDIAYCESNFKSDAYGDGGKAYGVYQFHKPTFKMFAKEKGEKLDYYDTEDNIKLAIWALANKKEKHWSCYKKLALK